MNEHIIQISMETTRVWVRKR